MRQSKGAKGESPLGKDDRKTKQGYVDIKNMTIGELDELIVRQKKLLQNRSFLEKLPDHGKKIISFANELEMERKKKVDGYDKACELLFNLSLNDKSIGEMEWNQENLKKCKKELDSDDDDDDDDDQEEEKSNEINDEWKIEINPLKLLASHSGTATGKNKKIFFFENKMCNKDLKDVKKLLFVDKFCEKYDKVNDYPERFKPNQFKNNDKTLFITSAEQVKKRLGNKWEVTQATPPVPVYKNAMMITLSESLKLQKEQAEKLKEIEEKHATVKLLHNMHLKMGNKLPKSNTTSYRSTKNPFEESIEDDEYECSDSDDSDNHNNRNSLLTS